MTAHAELVLQAHAHLAGHRFGAAESAFAQADRTGELSTDDVLAWGSAAWWLGHVDHALELAELGHRRLLADGQAIRAAKEAVGLGFLLLLRGDLSAGSGWLRRGRSVLESAPDDAARGYVVHLDAEQALHAGEPDRAAELARSAVDLARRSDDESLLASALMTQGTALVRHGFPEEGMPLLDEAMLPVRAGRLAPEVAGNLYCQMIALCWELADLRRAREWTAATERWCADFDSAVMFSGICRMHRVQLRHLGGEWDLAEVDARQVCAELVGMNTEVVAEGHYLLGELMRLRGATDQAEAAYRRAHELGRDPQPGRALLTAQTGRPEAALASLQTLLAADQRAEYARAPLLRAVVDLALTVGEPDVARAAADRLASIASRWRSDGLLAESAHAGAAVRVATGEPAAALPLLREAISRWHGLGAPLACAQARRLLGEAYLALGDDAAASLELDAAAQTFAALGARVDEAELARRRPGAHPPGGLTPREVDVLGLVAHGGTNRQVARELVLSEKTVARHLANVYRKLGVSTRTAAVARARRAGLLPRG